MFKLLLRITWSCVSLPRSKTSIGWKLLFYCYVQSMSCGTYIYISLYYYVGRWFIDTFVFSGCNNHLTLKALKYSIQTTWRPKCFSIWNQHKCLSSFRFISIPMLWSSVIIIILLFQCEDRLQTSESDVYRRQILTSKVDPRPGRVNSSRCIKASFSTCEEWIISWGLERIFLLNCSNNSNIFFYLSPASRHLQVDNYHQETFRKFSWKWINTHHGFDTHVSGSMLYMRNILLNGQSHQHCAVLFSLFWRFGKKTKADCFRPVNNCRTSFYSTCDKKY